MESDTLNPNYSNNNNNNNDDDDNNLRNENNNKPFLYPIKKDRKVSLSWFLLSKICRPWAKALLPL